MSRPPRHCRAAGVELAPATQRYGFIGAQAGGGQLSRPIGEASAEAARGLCGAALREVREVRFAEFEEGRQGLAQRDKRALAGRS